MQGGLVWGIILVIAVAAYLVRRWTKTGKAPETALKCLNCPKLLESKRRWIVATAGMGLIELVTLAWWGLSAAPR